MTSPSADTMRIGSDSDPSKPTTKATSDRASQGPYRPTSDSINRFLTDQDQHPPVGLGPVQNQDEAKAAGEARMLAILLAFDAEFGSGGQAPGN